MRGKTVCTLGVCLGMFGLARLALGANTRLLNRIPTSSRMVFYLASMQRFDHLLATIARHLDNQDGGNDQMAVPPLQTALASMGLPDAINLDGSVAIVVPGNTIGVALDNVPSIFILPISKRKNFCRDTSAKSIGHGFYQGEIRNFDLGMPHTEKFVFLFAGHHALCGKTVKSIAAFEHAQHHLSPSQVAGVANVGTPLLSVRLNMPQEAFELRAGITAMIGMQGQLLGPKPKPSLRTMDWQRLEGSLINQTESLTITLSQQGRVLISHVHITAKPNSAMAQLFAAQHTLSARTLNVFPLHHYLLASACAINWRAVDEFASPFFQPKSKPAAGADKGRKSAMEKWIFPWLINHMSSCVLVAAGKPNNPTASMLAHFDSRIAAKTMRSHITALEAFLPEGSLIGLKIGKVDADGVALELGNGGAADQYRVGKIDDRSLLLARKDDFPKLANSVVRKTISPTRTYRRLMRSMKRYLSPHMILAVFYSARAATANAPKAATGALAFPVHHRPLLFMLSRDDRGIDVDYVIPPGFINSIQAGAFLP